MRKTQSRHARSESSVDDHRGRASLSARVLATTPVKGTALHFPDSLRLGPRGAQANRSFYLVDEHGGMVNSKRHGPLVPLRAEYSPEERWLSRRFPDGAIVAREVSARDAHVTIDRRRFRMLIEVGGCYAYDEDAWIGATVRIRTAHVHGVGPVPRCVVTRQDPGRSVRDRPTLRLLLERRGARSGGALDTRVDHLPDGGRLGFRVYGTVEVPGEMCVGDAVTVRPREDAA